MAHYALNLASAMQAFAECQICVIRDADSDVSVWESVPTLFLDRSARGSTRRVLEKYNPVFYRHAVAVIAEHRPQLVHITAASNGLHSLVSACRSRGVRTVFTLHDPIRHEERTTVWGGFVRLMQQRLEMPAALRRVDAVHVHSALHAKAVDETLGAEIARKTYVVQHGAGISRSIAAGNMVPRELLGIRKDLPTVLCFGRIEPYKGVDLLIAAARRLQDRGVGLNVLIAGAGELANLLPLPENVVVINRFIEDSEISAIFRSADLVVLPYRSATQSGVVPLAYAFSKPVIVTRVGALEEVVTHGQTGLCIAPGDVEGLATSIQQLVSSPDVMAAMGQAAKESAEGRLSWGEAARHHFGHYEQVIRQGDAAVKAD